jgi:ureidoacrylate peracid hydrolase
MLDDTANNSLADWLRSKAQARLGRDYIYESFRASKTALVVVDMQNYFMQPEFLAGCPMAIEIVPTVNRMAADVRSKGGVVVWVQTTAAPEATKDWGVYQELFSPENWARRDVELAEDHEGYALATDLNVLEDDLFVKKTRFSAFIPGSSDIDAQLKVHNIDTLLISGVATGVCCEATARDGMMLNYRIAMVSDALASMTIESHENAHKGLYGMFSDVQTVDEISEKLS